MNSRLLLSLQTSNLSERQTTPNTVCAKVTRVNVCLDLSQSSDFTAYTPNIRSSTVFEDIAFFFI